MKKLKVVFLKENELACYYDFYRKKIFTLNHLQNTIDMKKYAIILVMSFLPLLLQGQDKPQTFSQLFDSYSGTKGFQSIHITQHMFNLFKNVTSEAEESDFRDIASSLQSIKIMTLEPKEAGGRGLQFRRQLNELVTSSGYKELMVIRDGAETTAFLIKEEGDYITEFVMAVTGEDSPTLIFLEGRITLNQVSRMSRMMNVSGFEHLDKLNE